MKIDSYLEGAQKLQVAVLNFIENEDNAEKNLKLLRKIFDEQKIIENHDDFKTFLYLLLNIIENHHRIPGFFGKFEQIFNIFKNDIQNNFSYSEILSIFDKKQRILMSLIKTELLKPEDMIQSYYDELNQCEYELLFPELEPHLFHKPAFTITDKENYEENRHAGENEDIICKMIREDSIDEFIRYVNQKCISLQSLIPPSIYETNSFLIGRKETSLIEYAAFFGSIQIFNFLRMSQVDLTPSLWLYAIHSNCAELIHLLEELHVELPDNSYCSILEESIKCHHNEFAQYFIDKYSNEEDFSNVFQNAFIYCNFYFVQRDKLNELDVFDLVKCGYLKTFVNLVLKEGKIDVNRMKKIQNEGTKEERLEIETTVLHFAIENENVQLVQLLLEGSSVDVNIMEKSNEKIYVGYTYKYVRKHTAPLHVAIRKSNIEIIKLLLNYPKINVNIPYEINEYEYYDRNSKTTALNMAVEKGNVEIVKLLLESKNIDVNSVKFFKSRAYYESKAPIHTAIENKFDEIAKLLLLHDNIDVNSSYIYESMKKIKKPTLIFAVENRRVEIVKILLTKPNLDINCLNIYLERIDLGGGFPEVDMYNKSKGLNEYVVVNREDEIICRTETALYIAVQNNYNEIVELLIANKNININLLCEISKKFIVEHYEYESEKIESNKITALHLAVQNANAEAVKLLLSCPTIDIKVESEKINSLKYTKDANIIEKEIHDDNIDAFENVTKKTALDLAKDLNLSGIIDLFKK
ncbi:hypothetical protein M9Y10_000276 [Tritrichomonas musculus]|uniref:DUF3447 domain-containing protein n=1 Tax=Tritrichomonas musculus TaxID=1915356 RepID=A0ABR2L4T3_9EUKA